MRANFVRIFLSRGLRHASSTLVSTKSKRRGMKHLYLKDLDTNTVLFYRATPTEFRVKEDACRYCVCINKAFQNPIN